MTLDLPWPPTANNLHAVVRGRKILSRVGREYRGAVLAACAEQHAPHLGNARLRITLHVHAPDKRRRDIANIEKACIDGLVYASVFQDDSQIDELRLVRGDMRRPGRVLVTLEVIP